MIRYMVVGPGEIYSLGHVPSLMAYNEIGPRISGLPTVGCKRLRRTLIDQREATPGSLPWHLDPSDGGSSKQTLRL
jgi:hypothetical protein